MWDFFGHVLGLGGFTALMVVVAVGFFDFTVKTLRSAWPGARGDVLRAA